jgi:drug/metabolite transporter (DMT)-like permease
LLYSYSLKYVKASKGSILSVLEPLSAALFSALLLGESLETLQILGVALALSGVILLFQFTKPTS